MKKSTLWKQVGDFIVGKGFYIVLFLCVATIGISGYYLADAFIRGGEDPGQTVTGGAQVTVPSKIEQQLPPPDKETVIPPEDSGEEPQPEEPEIKDPDPLLTEDPGTGSQPPAEKPAVNPEPTPTVPVYTWPVKGELLSNFSLEVLAYDETMGDWRTHSGVDIAAVVGTRVLAMSNGTVSRVYQDDLMGSAVIIDHENGLQSRYYNLNEKPTVSEGDAVVTGTVIGAVGETAIAEIGRASHLHLEVFLNGKAVDPVDYLPKYGVN